jgi:hypothetical protein
MREEMYVKEHFHCRKNLKCFIHFVLFQASVGTIILKTLDIVTIVVHPAMTAGTTYSQSTSRI